MSLKEFHVVFITVSILLSLGAAGWGMVQYRQGYETSYVAFSLVSLLVAIGLVGYEAYFLQKTKS